MAKPEEADLVIWQGVRREGIHHTFDDKRPGLFPLRIMPIDNEHGSPPRHTHDFFEIVYIRIGSAIHLHGDSRYPIGAGDCMFIVPGDVEGFDERNNLCLTNVLFYEEIFGPYLDEFRAVRGFNEFFSTEPLFRKETAFRHKLHLGPAQQRRMMELLGSLEAELSSEKTGYRMVGRSIFVEIVVFLCRCFEETIKTGDVRKEFSGKERAINAAITFLEENYRKDIRLKDIVDKVHLSQSWLYDAFKSATGTSLFDYLTRFRLDAARKLLRESELSVKEISYQVGFHDPNYFSRAFARAFNEAPTAFRRKTGK